MDNLLPIRQNFNQSNQIDARIISLDTRGLLSALPTGPFTNNRYNAFSYYASITVDQVYLPAGSTENPLNEAYKQSLACVHPNQKNSVLSQLVFAFTDVSDDSGHGHYTQEQIRDFWADNKHPVFFMTMINIAKDATLESVITRIDTLFDKQLHLAYLTFDHTDIILFCKGYSFQNYVQLLYELNYESNSKVEDTITCFGFSEVARSYSEQNCESADEFSALLTFGIGDYNKAQQFQEQVYEMSNAEKIEINVFSMLGRNDMGISCQKATFKWLVKIWDIVKQVDSNSEYSLINDEDHWYTTYDLQIQVLPTPLTTSKLPHRSLDVSKLRQYMEYCYNQFESAYNSLYNSFKFSRDLIWLRWVKDSSALAVELLGNSLSFDLGVCIVPQFFDLLSYTTRLLTNVAVTASGAEESDSVGIDKAREKKWDYLERLERSFSSFFAALAVLIDSTNQTNRQFVQVPSFHLPSFTVPPKIAAFFSAAAYRLLDIFHDDKETSYNLMLVPRTINNLGVESRAIQEVLPKHQWLEIMISEPSYYNMRLTLETMGHEISHVSGQENRCRNVRRDLFIQCAIANYVDLLLFFIPKLVVRLYPSLEENALCPYETFGKPLFELTSRIFDTAKDAFGESLITDNPSRVDILIKLNVLIDGFYSNPLMYRALIDELWWYDNEFRGLTRGEQDSQETAKNELTSIEYLSTLSCCTRNESDSILTMDENDPELRWLKDAAVKEASEQRDSLTHDRFFEIILKLTRTVREVVIGESNPLLCDYDIILSFAQDYWANLEIISNYYYETFADLQMILLFDLDWSQYCRLILRESDELVHDAPLRVIAVAKALVEQGIWDLSSINGTNDKFLSAAALVSCDIYSFEDFNEQNVDPIVVYYLVKYLKQCIVAIKKNFNNPDTQKKMQALRTMHQTLADGIPILKLQNELRSFIDDFYRDFIAGRCINVEDPAEPSAGPGK